MTAAVSGPDWSATLRHGTEAELRGWLELAKDACATADELSMAAFRHELQISRKPDQTYVTTVDRAIEAAISERILGVHPEHGLVGEEHGVRSPGASVVWYVDPIDGTHNYLRGIPVFATLLAVARDGEVQAAAISAPALRARWFGWRGGGAWATTAGSPPRRLSTSAITRLDEAQVLYGDGPAIDASGLAPGFRGMLADAWRSRGFGDFWGYALVAEGAAEAMIEVDLAPWDVAAPTLLVEEAGGRLTGLDGRRSLEAGAYLATNGGLHEALLRRLQDREPRA